jgi:hypothetical protein
MESVRVVLTFIGRHDLKLFHRWEPLEEAPEAGQWQYFDHVGTIGKE